MRYLCELLNLPLAATYHLSLVCVSTCQVGSRSIPDLIGSGGSVVKALRAACGVHMNFPPDKKRTDETKPVKVGNRDC